MTKINYIASAGTGKTYQLVEDVYNEYISKGISIENLFISTFTEKSAGELKNRIIKKLKTELKTNNNNRNQIFENIYKIQEAYIGTIHSLCLRLIKEYPEESSIPFDIDILEEGFKFDFYFNKAFEQYIDTNINIDETLKFIQDKKHLYKIFKDIYDKRSRLSKKDNLKDEIEDEKKEIFLIKDELIIVLDKLIEYYKDFKEYFKIDIFKIRKLLKFNRFISIKVEVNKGFPRILKKANMEKDGLSTNFDNKNYIEKIEDDFIKLLSTIKSKALNLNFLIVLNEYNYFYEIFNNIKKENNFMDYNDIVIKCTNLLKENTKIKEIIQNKFNAVIIDEFQDTDNLQLELVNLLSEKSDLIILGDPKQCIYEWRNANLEDYLYFIENNEFEHRNLDTCYRSSKNLIKFYNRIFSNNGYSFLSGLDEKYRIETKSNDDTNTEDIEIILSNNEEQVILEKIKQYPKENYGDILILFRDNKKANKLIKLFKNNSIPFISYLNSNLMGSFEIQTILNLLKAIKYPFDKLSLLATLKSPIFGFSDLDIFQIKENLYIYNIEEFKRIEEILKNIDNYSIYDFLKILYKEYNILEKFSLYPDSLQKIENLNKLLSMALDSDRNNLQMRDFIENLENTNERNGNIITDDNSFVKLMTIHSSKGLESKIIIIPFLLNNPNNQDAGFHTIENELMIKIKDSKRAIAMSSNFDEDKVKENLVNESKRLLYVAFTRAKNKLIILLNEDDNKKSKTSKNLIKSKLAELFDELEKDYPFKNENIDDIENEENYWTNLKKEQENLLNEEKLLEEIDNNRINDYKRSISYKSISSVSQIMKAEKIEDYNNINFYEPDNNIKNDASKLGTLVHSILENFSFPKNIDLAKEEIISIISKKKNDKNLLDEAKTILLNFINSNNYNEISNSNILFKEMPFTIKENNRYIEGIIDLVYQINNRIIVMDYKTNIIRDKEKLEKNYKIQKDYYTKAIRLVFPEKEENSIEFKFCWLRE